MWQSGCTGPSNNGSCDHHSGLDYHLCGNLDSLALINYPFNVQPLVGGTAPLPV